MSQSTYLKNRQCLQQLMQQAGISNLSQLSQLSGVSEWQLIRLQYGLMPKMPLEMLPKLAEALKVPFIQFLTYFCPESLLS
ncbi:MAG: helix-turn-helix domain-containing protein, partial [Microcystaceae cyanobacterium]